MTVPPIPIVDMNLTDGFRRQLADRGINTLAELCVVVEGKMCREVFPEMRIEDLKECARLIHGRSFVIPPATRIT